MEIKYHNMFKQIFFLSLIIISISRLSNAKTNNTVKARKQRAAPLLGWSTWCTDAHCSDLSAMPVDWCSSKEILSVANDIATNGLLEAGWNHILLDDCWGIRDNTTNKITWVKSRFPEGMPWLIEQIHQLGLKFGLYTAVGQHACHWNSPSWPHSFPFTGSWPYYNQDAEQFIDWKVDYVKLDDCGPWPHSPHELVQNFSTSLRIAAKKMNHDIWLNLGGPFQQKSNTIDIQSNIKERKSKNDFLYEPEANMSCREVSGSWCGKYSNSFRVWDDHHDSWQSTANIIEMALARERRTWYGGGDSFVDPDFIFTGGQGCSNKAPHIPGKRCPGQTNVEYQTEFSIWAIAGGQLVIASDPRNMSDIQRDAWFNKEILDVFFDVSSFNMIKVIRPVNDSIAWLRPLSDAYNKKKKTRKKKTTMLTTTTTTTTKSCAAIVIYNSRDSTIDTIPIDFINIPNRTWNEETSLNVRDLWKHKNLGVHRGHYNAINLASHGSMALLLCV